MKYQKYKNTGSTEPLKCLIGNRIAEGLGMKTMKMVMIGTLNHTRLCSQFLVWINVMCIYNIYMNPSGLLLQCRL